MIFDAFDAHWLKGAVANVQGDLRKVHAPKPQRVDERGWEMQTSSRRRNRPAAPREYGLIPVAILPAIFSLDVRRQRNVADRIDGLVHGGPILGPQPDDAPPVEVA